jgi:hypothetical protein
MAGLAFDLLKTGGCRPESGKQHQNRLAGMSTILSIRFESAAGFSPYLP